MTKASGIGFFLGFIALPLTFSIITGIGLGFISYAAVKLLSGRARNASFATYVIAVAFGVKFSFL